MSANIVGEWQINANGYRGLLVIDKRPDGRYTGYMQLKPPFGVGVPPGGETLIDIQYNEAERLVTFRRALPDYEQAYTGSVFVTYTPAFSDAPIDNAPGPENERQVWMTGSFTQPEAAGRFGFVARTPFLEPVN